MSRSRFRFSEATADACSADSDDDAYLTDSLALGTFANAPQDHNSSRLGAGVGQLLASSLYGVGCLFVETSNASMCLTVRVRTECPSKEFLSVSSNYSKIRGLEESLNIIGLCSGLSAAPLLADPCGLSTGYESADYLNYEGVTR